MIRYPADLPITPRREDILAAMRGHQVVILAGETGSGKTTQLPKMCLEVLGEGRGMIGCTQPRRVAAMSVSRRVAEELDVRWGREVGCKMRFSDDTSRETRVKFMTDGILLAEIQSDPLLRAYSMLILDEAHERSLNIDFLLGYLKGLLGRRPDLKLVVTSATIDTEAFSQHFGGAPIIEVSGRLYPVEIRYRPVGDNDEDPTHIDEAVTAVEDVLIETNEGDVLVFMPTERDIRETSDILDGRLGRGIEVLALYGRMAAQEQQRVFSPGPKRRVIVATNVAETSITLPRIRYVVDTGLARMSRYNPRTRTKRLPVEAVSQSSANQRAGRAGRVEAGVCIRLYAEDDYNKRPRFTQPEIQRANLAEVILRMKAFRLGEIETFPFLNPPVSASIRAGYDLLRELGALNDTHEMTELGRELANLPLDPTLGRMLLQAREEGCLEDMLVLAAGLSIPDPRERPEERKEMANAAHKAFAVPESDFLTLLKIWNAAPNAEGGGGKNQLRKFCRTNFLSFTRMTEWRDVWRQLKDTITAPVAKPTAVAIDDRIHRCILAGHLGHIAMRQERNAYKAGGNREVMIFPGSSLYERREKNAKPGQEKTKQPLWIVAGEIVQTSQLFAR
ncbi:MAG: ATP-dependent RNA helicase HrpA, partial [Prosthecobacter sp.]|nr:ATP-dependent RNA helicase HrpA [Prosthecobacter sp.]